MNEEEVQYSRADGVARIVLNRPARLNAFTQTLVRGLHRAFIDAEQDPEVRCILLTGAGEAFSSGGDLSLLHQLACSSAMEVYGIIKEGFDTIHQIYSIPKPVITAVNGVATGAGCSLALCGDVILASDRARFGMVFSQLNLAPDTGASFLLPKLVGLLRAKDLIYSGRIISAEEALSYGMVSEVFPHDQLQARAMERAQIMSRWPTQAIKIAKNLLHRSVAGGDLATILELEAEAQSMLLSSENVKEAIRPS